MVAVTVEGKTYELKHRLTVKQMKMVDSLGRKFGDIPGRIEREGEEKVVADLMSVTDAEADFLFVTIADCLGLSKEQVDDMEYIHAVAVFGKLLEVSVPPKNSLSPSEKPTTATTSSKSTV